jgi:hypothetical protein
MMGIEQGIHTTSLKSDEYVWSEQVDDDPVRWRAFFLTPKAKGPRPCGHRHHTEHSALSCGQARRRAVTRIERYEE